MPAAPSPHRGVPGAEAPDLPDLPRHLLERARQRYLEDPKGALADAVQAHETARLGNDYVLCARAVTLQGVISLHRGDPRSAMALAVDAERHVEAVRDRVAGAELAALKCQLSFFTGGYSDAVSYAELAVEQADRTGDIALRVFVRRTTCVALGNIGVADWPVRLQSLLSLTIVAGSPWDQAIARNDLACHELELGNPQDAHAELDRAFQLVTGLTPANSFVLGLLHCTRADTRLQTGDGAGALADAERSIELLTDGGDPNPYLLGMAVRAEVQARMALGRPLDAQAAGEGALTWLGERVPQTRSLILATLAEALHEAGRPEEAYEALARSTELERQAFRELSELKLSLERATLEAGAARRESDSLTLKNRQLAEAHAELERRAEQLEALQAQLRDQAERDWLTGLYNRRYLAGELDRMSRQGMAGDVSLAVLDIDRFKAINDRFGHEAGDQVLIRIGRLLADALRESDVVVRSGGEEFILLMPSTGERAAEVCCERVRRRIADQAWDAIGDDVSLTCSIGIASAHEPEDLLALLRVADQRLYEAKNSGRDRIVSRCGSVSC